MSTWWTQNSKSKFQKGKKTTENSNMTIFPSHLYTYGHKAAAAVRGCRAEVCNDVNTWSQLDTPALTDVVSHRKLTNEQIFALLSLENSCFLTSVSLLQGEAKHLHSATRPPPSSTSACFSSSTFISSVHLIQCCWAIVTLLSAVIINPYTVSSLSYDHEFKKLRFNLNFGTVFCFFRTCHSYEYIL